MLRMQTRFSQIIDATKQHQPLAIALIAMVVLRLPSLFEGFWYGDEGIYAAVAQGMLNGQELYAEVWDHKPPMIYWLYYLAGRANDWDLALVLIKSLGILSSGISIWLIYRILKLFDIPSLARNISLGFSAALFGLPVLEANIANAEIFFIPFNLAVILLLLQQRWYGLIGALAAIGLLFKFHSGFESALVLLFILAIQQWSQSLSWLDVVRRLVKIAVGGLLIIAPYAAYVVVNNLQQPVLDAIIWYNFDYTSYAAEGLQLSSIHLSHSVVSLIGAVLALIALYVAARERLLSIRSAIILAIVIIEYTAAILPGRSYSHYLLQVVPGAVLAIAVLTTSLQQQLGRRHVILALSCLAAAVIMVNGFYGDDDLPGSATVFNQYYAAFVTDHVLHSTSGQFPYNQAVNDRNSRQLAEYIDNIHPNQSYFFWGNLPWVQAITSNHFTNTYVVWYHQSYDHPANQADLEAAEVLVIDTQSWEGDTVLAEQEAHFDHRQDLGQFVVLSDRRQ